MIFNKQDNQAAIQDLEKMYEQVFPKELRNYLQDHLDDAIFKDLTWRKNPHEIKEAQLSLFKDTLVFDLTNNTGYWPAVFGEQPENHEERIKKAFNYITQLPPLIPVGRLKYYAPTAVENSAKSLPIISFHQFVDTIYAYKDLNAYQHGSTITAKEYSELPRAIGWCEVFDGLGATNEALYRDTSTPGE